MKELFLQEMRELNSNSNRGNLVGLQPYMTPSDYRDEQSFFEKLDGYFFEAAKKNWFNEKTIVVLPEYVGTWLVVANESPRVYEAKTIEGAMASILLKNLFSFIHYLIFAEAQDRVKYAIFRCKAEVMATIYQNVFSKLAAKYKVTIVAGSIVLPELKWDKTQFKVQGRKLYNTTIMYRPDGSAYPEALKKVYPTPAELVFTACGNEDQLPVYDTPAGKMGVLNCADSWYSTTYKVLKSKGAEFLAVPSFVEKDHDVHLPWRGNNITPPPPEFDSKDFFNITYDDAWVKYAMPARIHNAGFKNGMNVFLRGKFWSLGSDGRSIIINQGSLERGADVNGATLQNLWLS